MNTQNVLKKTWDNIRGLTEPGLVAFCDSRVGSHLANSLVPAAQNEVFDNKSVGWVSTNYVPINTLLATLKTLFQSLWHALIPTPNQNMQDNIQIYSKWSYWKTPKKHSKTYDKKVRRGPSPPQNAQIGLNLWLMKSARGIRSKSWISVFYT